MDRAVAAADDDAPSSVDLCNLNGSRRRASFALGAVECQRPPHSTLDRLVGRRSKALHAAIRRTNRQKVALLAEGEAERRAGDLDREGAREEVAGCGALLKAPDVPVKRREPHGAARRVVTAEADRTHNRAARSELRDWNQFLGLLGIRLANPPRARTAVAPRGDDAIARDGDGRQPAAVELAKQ